MKRNGSALLIVLGMMAFMIVSAVAFSAYMRSARLPSSYLRRSSASRQLVKGALAEAIDSLDRSIANNPHPNVGSASLTGQNKNIWRGRVLCATNQLLEASQTIPVLTLEGLAYIPPPLVNEVRYYSRRTPSAAWRSFGFDAGRYAFCVVDVSDYFDVNRMSADTPRSSASSRRISLAYLFENGRSHTSAGAQASEWDTFMEQFRQRDDATLSFKYDSKVPLVSVADLNLALGESGRAGFSSPFCKYVNTSGGDGFYNLGGDDEADLVRRMTFVTDSWYAAPDDDDSDYDEIYDLADPQCQPFTAALLGGNGGPRSVGSATLVDIMSSGQKAKVRLLDSMPAMGLVSLFDYLDANSMPVSLACPTLERTPMICGLKPTINASFSLKLDEEQAKKVTDAGGQVLSPTPKTSATREAYATYEYTINPEFATTLAALGLETLVVYPFAHDDAVRDTTFSVDARATFFLTTDADPVKMRTRNSANTEMLHVQNANSFTSDKGLSPSGGTITVPFRAKSQNFKVTNASQEENALFEVPLQSLRLAGSETSRAPIARIRYKWTQTWDEESGRYTNQTKPADAEIAEAHCGVPPLNSKGEPSPEFTSDEKFLSIVKAGGAAAKVTLNMAVMARVTDSTGKKVYDLVPAHIRDDKTFNNIDNNRFPSVSQICGEAYPVMKFSTPVTFEFSAQGLDAARTVQTVDATVPKAVRVDDPRYNYAPESWYDAEGDISKQTWLASNLSRDRDGDIYLATSDQGYMQSIYELAFLPRFSDLQSVGGNAITGELQNPDDGRAAFGSKNDAKNAHMMWSTYRPFATNYGDADDFEGLGFSSAGTGVKVNPYSDSTNVVMAAFANTPVDWRMASTNNQEEAVEEMKAAEFNKKYAWNQYSSDAKFAWSDLEAIAGRFMNGVCPLYDRGTTAARHVDWRDAWHNLDWKYTADRSDELCGVQLSGGTELWGVDRKFLYGYWRDCFAAKQQLFLVFVRAEPLMMGGAGLNQSPPQLGARAVALVWRDPTKSAESGDTGTGYPHRTRVLFYRQME